MTPPKTKAYSLLRHIAWSVWLNHDPNQAFFMMAKEYTGYFDDSGHPDDQCVVLVAGAIASEDQWLRFEDEWKDRLHREFGRVPVFHVTDFMAGKGEFKGVKASEHQALLVDLARIICLRTRRLFGSAVPMNSYRKINDEYALEEALGAPYALAGSCMLKGIDEWKEQYAKYDPYPILIFEDGSKHKGDLREVFAKDKRPEPIFRDKAELVSLQAACFFAWEFFNFITTAKPTPELSYFKNNHMSYRVGLVTERDLLRMCKDYPVPKRIKIEGKREIVFHTAPKRVRRRTIDIQPKVRIK